MKFLLSDLAPLECKAGKILASNWLPPSALFKPPQQEFSTVMSFYHQMIMKVVKLALEFPSHNSYF